MRRHTMKFDHALTDNGRHSSGTDILFLTGAHQDTKRSLVADAEVTDGLLSKRAMQNFVWRESISRS
jgi:hypothetical protein